MSIVFPHTRTRRLSVRLKELTLDQAIGILGLPGERHELTLTTMLRDVAMAEQPTPGHVTDPQLWTVEERTLLVTKYLSQVCDDGPDFKIGDGVMSDYLMLDRDLEVGSVDLGVVAGKPCRMVPLVGAAAGILEMVCRKRKDWILGAIACQLLVDGEGEPDWAGLSDVDAIKFVTGRMERLGALAESDFSEVYNAYWNGARTLEHFFNVDFDDHGIILQPVEKEGAGRLGPVRFPASSCVSSLARNLSE